MHQEAQSSHWQSALCKKGKPQEDNERNDGANCKDIGGITSPPPQILACTVLTSNNLHDDTVND